MEDKNEKESTLEIEDTGETLEDFQWEEEASAQEAEQPQEDWKAKYEALHENYLRILAELQNLTKRQQREKQEFQQFALQEFFRAFLPILDNLHRALEAPSQTVDSLREGVNLIVKQIDQLMVNSGVELIPTKPGDPFDPYIHEAIETQLDETVDIPIISEVLQKGYRQRGRLLRPTLVKVKVPKTETGKENHEQDSGD